MNNARRFTNVRRTITALVCILAAIAVSKPAMATVQGGKLQQVEWNAGVTANPILILELAGGAFFSAGLASPGCGVDGGPPANSIDTLKAFLSTALAALVAGKSVVITYSTCNSAAYISDLIVVP